MGNVPVIHEIGTTFKSAGHAITGDTDKARKAWTDYSKKSVIGSGVCAAYYAADKDTEKAREYGKGMGRCTGEALCGGGLLSNVPYFQEVKHAGDSLGHAMAGEKDKAKEVWTKEYINKGALSTTVRTIHYTCQKNQEMAKKMENATRKAWSKTGTEIGTTAACVAAASLTGGAGAAFIAVGATTSFASNVADQAVDYAWGTCFDCGNPLKENNEWTICASTQKEHKKQNFKNLDWGDAIGDGLAGGVSNCCKGPTKKIKKKWDMATAERKVLKEKFHYLDERKALVVAEYDVMTRKTLCQKFTEEFKPLKPWTDTIDMKKKEKPRPLNILERAAECSKLNSGESAKSNDDIFVRTL